MLCRTQRASRLPSAETLLAEFDPVDGSRRSDSVRLLGAPEFNGRDVRHAGLL